MLTYGQYHWIIKPWELLAVQIPLPQARHCGSNPRLRPDRLRLARLGALRNAPISICDADSLTALHLARALARAGFVYRANCANCAKNTARLSGTPVLSWAVWLASS